MPEQYRIVKFAGGIEIDEIYCRTNFEHAIMTFNILRMLSKKGIKLELQVERDGKWIVDHDCTVK